jgi:hypothetical protein
MAFQDCLLNSMNSRTLMAASVIETLIPALPADILAPIKLRLFIANQHGVERRPP